MKTKKVLIALPGLIPSGGINVVIGLINVLQKCGYHVDILSRESGELYDEFSNMGVAIRIEQKIMEESLITWIMENYDAVIVNTLQMCGLVYMLNGREIEVKWWIHEPPVFFSKISDIIPQMFWDHLAENVTIFSAGNIVYEHILKTYGKESLMLNFGVEDCASQVPDVTIDIVSSDKVTFLLPSIIFQPVKGQDILGAAIADLLPDYDSRAEFIFIGNKIEELERYYEEIKNLEKIKTNVKVLDIISKPELMMLMKQVDCIVAPSREDATNSCIVEGMMLSKICLCSDATGVSRYMEDCVNGFVFQKNHVDEIRARIMLIIDNISRLDVVAKNGRKVYENVFSMDVFEKNVKKYWKI